MNMVMNNDGAGGLFQANSLQTPTTWDDELRSRNVFGRVDLLFTNPPFGSKIPIDDPAILETYDLGHVWQYDDVSDKWKRTDSVQLRKWRKDSKSIGKDGESISRSGRKERLLTTTLCKLPKHSEC